MPITLDSVINQDSSAFVEVVDRMYLNILESEFRNFRVIDGERCEAGDDIVYGSHLWPGIGIGTSTNGENTQIYLTVNGSRFNDCVIFYSDRVDSIYFKACTLIVKDERVLSTRIEAYNAYWSSQKAYRLSSPDTVEFDKNFMANAKPNRMATFTPDQKARLKLEEFASKVVEKSKNVFPKRDHGQFPGSTGRRNR